MHDKSTIQIKNDLIWLLYSHLDCIYGAALSFLGTWQPQFPFTFIVLTSAKVCSTEYWMTSEWVNNDWTHFCARCFFKTSEEQEYLSQLFRSFVITALDDRFLTIIGGLLLLITCFMIVSVCRNYCWYQLIARKCVSFSVSFVVKPKAPLVSIVSSQMCLKTAENGKNACTAKRACHISTICCVTHLKMCAHPHKHTFPKHL